MESRDRILDAAARVYAASGFRGATTRRIAEEAGVNEVTIFRHFGSKAALIDEVVRASADRTRAPGGLPAVPVDPEGELTAWCTRHLTGLRDCRAFIRKTMSEHEERPNAVRSTAVGPQKAARELRTYMVRLRKHGFVDWGADPSAEGGYRINPYAAGAMLMGALFADAMGRDMMPGMYPQPEERAPAMYVRLFLRAIGLRQQQHHTGTNGRRNGQGNGEQHQQHAEQDAPPTRTVRAKRAGRARTRHSTPSSKGTRR